MGPIGLLFFLRRRARFNRMYEQNQRLRRRLDKYEPRPPKPAPEPRTGEGWLALLVVLVLIAFVILVGNAS